MPQPQSLIILVALASPTPLLYDMLHADFKRGCSTRFVVRVDICPILPRSPPFFLEVPLHATKAVGDSWLRKSEVQHSKRHARLRHGTDFGYYKAERVPCHATAPT